MDRNQLLLILDEANAIDLSGASDASDVADRETRTVARFILEQCIPDPDLSAALRTLVEGFVLQNTLLLRDFGTLKNNFETLTVFFDTTFLFALRGIRGQAEEQAARETVQILTALRARLAVFESTLKEMRRILFVYESRLGTSSGKATLHPREEMRYFLRNAYTPGDPAHRSSCGPNEHRLVEEAGGSGRPQIARTRRLVCRSFATKPDDLGEVPELPLRRACQRLLIER